MIKDVVGQEIQVGDLVSFYKARTTQFIIVSSIDTTAGGYGRGNPTTNLHGVTVAIKAKKFNAKNGLEEGALRYGVRSETLYRALQRGLVKHELELLKEGKIKPNYSWFLTKSNEASLRPEIDKMLLEASELIKADKPLKRKPVLWEKPKVWIKST